MAVLQSWLRHPKRLWFRKVFFQVHLWTGIGFGLYIVVVCVSGSAVVFRDELTKYFTHGPRTVAVSAGRLSEHQLVLIAERGHPSFTVSRVLEAKKATDAVEVWLDQARTGIRIQREFDPYTGADLGSARPLTLVAFLWLIDFHGNLALGTTGRTLNGAGGFLAALLCLSGMVIWWPGIDRWRNSVMFAWRGDWKRFNWELHSTIGFWTVSVILLFALTGAYLGLTAQFEQAINKISPLRVYRLDVADDTADADDQGASLDTSQVDPNTFEVLDTPTNGQPQKLTFGDELVRWAPRVHYGRFAGTGVKWLWVVLGLAPPVLFCTGFMMWWSRVLRPELRKFRNKRSRATPIVETREARPSSSASG